MLPKEDRIRLSTMLNLTLPGIFYPRKTRYDSDQVSRYSILSKEIRIKLERDANISPQGLYKIVHFLLLLLTKGLLSLFVAIPKLRGSVVVIKDARDFQNLILPASIALHAKHKCNICFEENLVLPKMLLQYLGWKPSFLEIQ